MGFKIGGVNLISGSEDTFQEVGVNRHLVRYILVVGEGRVGEDQVAEVDITLNIDAGGDQEGKYNES